MINNVNTPDVYLAVDATDLRNYVNFIIMRSK